jgi:hypothetical protein
VKTSEEKKLKIIFHLLEPCRIFGSHSGGYDDFWAITPCHPLKSQALSSEMSVDFQGIKRGYTPEDGILYYHRDHILFLKHGHGALYPLQRECYYPEYIYSIY